MSSGNEIVMNFHMAADTFSLRMRNYGRLMESSADDAVRDAMNAAGKLMDATVPVDTRALQMDRSPVTRSGRISWSTGYSLPYAGVLEYGGYLRAGPKTESLGSEDLGEGFMAPSGVYSRQAPHGWVRKALLGAKRPLGENVRKALLANWNR
jgi:hypothetical protein